MNGDVKNRMNGKTILVVGGGGLLGEAICRKIIEIGANCVIADINVERVKNNLKDFTVSDDCEIMFEKVSITDKASIDNLIAKSIDKFGFVDALINTAYPRNTNYGRKFEEVEYTDFCENLNLHLGGYFLVSQRILEYFKSRHKGNLINISSIYGVIAPRFEIYENTPMTMPVEYAAIKAGLNHMTRYMAKYYAGNNIRINNVSLGGLLDRQPDEFLEKYKTYCLDKGMLDPADVVGAVLFLLSDDSKYINGQNIIVDDGFTL